MVKYLLIHKRSVAHSRMGFILVMSQAISIQNCLFNGYLEIRKTLRPLCPTTKFAQTTWGKSLVSSTSTAKQNRTHREETVRERKWEGKKSSKRKEDSVYGLQFQAPIVAHELKEISRPCRKPDWRNKSLFQLSFLLKSCSTRNLEILVALRAQSLPRFVRPSIRNISTFQHLRLNHGPNLDD